MPWLRRRAGDSAVRDWIRGRRGGVRGGLVAAEVAVTVVLLVGAGLLFRSLAELRAVDRGVDPDGLLIFQYSLPRTSAWAEAPVAFHS